MPGFAKVLKFNPHHDKVGRFSSGKNGDGLGTTGGMRQAISDHVATFAKVQAHLGKPMAASDISKEKARLWELNKPKATLTPNAKPGEAKPTPIPNASGKSKLTNYDSARDRPAMNAGRPITTSRTVNGRTQFLDNGIWSDAAYRPNRTGPNSAAAIRQNPNGGQPRKEGNTIPGWPEGLDRLNTNPGSPRRVRHNRVARRGELRRGNSIPGWPT